MLSGMAETCCSGAGLREFKDQPDEGSASLPPRKRVRRIPDYFNKQQGVLATAHGRHDASQLHSASLAAASLHKSERSDRQTTSTSHCLLQNAGAVSSASQAAYRLLESKCTDADTALLQPTSSESRQPRPTCQSPGAFLDEPACSGAPANAAHLQLPVLDFRNHGQTIYATCAGEVEMLTSDLLRQKVAAAGWDIEWRTTFAAGEPPRKTALMQICYQNSRQTHICLLLHVFYSGITPSLRAFLSNPAIAKVGVAARGDAHKVSRDFGTDVKGVVELMDSPIVQADTALESRSLANLTARYMQHLLPKGSQRLSNWERRPLSYEQQAYAASDAYASLRIHQILHSLPQPVEPERPAKAAVPVPAAQTQSQAPRELVWVPAEEGRQRMQPAKLAVYKMLIEDMVVLLLRMPESALQKLTIAQVAHRRKIQEGTVMAYLAEAITAGYGYNWPVAGCSEAAIPPLARLAKRLLIAAGASVSCNDITHELQGAGIGLQVLQEELGGGVSFGQLRLSLAHIGRQQLLAVDK